VGVSRHASHDVSFYVRRNYRLPSEPDHRDFHLDQRPMIWYIAFTAILNLGLGYGLARLVDANRAPREVAAEDSSADDYYSSEEVDEYEYAEA
jgi:hypothetical protein